jgi:hypothetical protein
VGADGTYAYSPAWFGWYSVSAAYEGGRRGVQLPNKPLQTSFVVTVAVVPIVKFAVYFTVVYTLRSLKYARASSASSDASPNAGARKPPRMN